MDSKNINSAKCINCKYYKPHAYWVAPVKCSNCIVYTKNSICQNMYREK